jgi:hypothetical protein
MFGVPAFWLLLLLVPTASFVGHFVIKAIRIEFFTPMQIIVSEHEYLTRHMSPEQIREIEAEYTTKGKSVVSMHGVVTEELGDDETSPRVKVNPAAIEKLHQSMSIAEREGAGHMANRKMRSSFVDNTPAEHSYFANGMDNSSTKNQDAENMVIFEYMCRIFFDDDDFFFFFSVF